MSRFGDSPFKNLEMSARRVLARQFRRRGGTQFVGQPQDAVPCGERPAILLLRQDKIGDALISVPVLRALRGRFPEAQIDILLGEANYSIRHALGNYINDALKYEKKPTKIFPLLRELRRRRYDVVVDLMDNASATSTAIVRFCGARYAVGVAKSNSAVYSHVVPLLDTARVHIVERIAQLLMPFGINPAEVPLDLEYIISDEERERAIDIVSGREKQTAGNGELRVTGYESEDSYINSFAKPSPTANSPAERRQFIIGLNISSSSDTRMWSEEHWITLAGILETKLSGARLVGFSAPTHRDILLRIAAQSAVQPVPSAASFHNFAALLSVCDGIITPDTSVVHLAAAWKTPCVVMFVRANPNALPWTPYNSPHRSFYAERDITSITPEEVAAGCIELFTVAIRK